MEVKQIPSYSSTILSSQSNHLLLKDISKLLIFSGCWQAICNLKYDDPGHDTDEGPFREAPGAFTDDGFTDLLHKNGEGMPALRLLSKHGE